MQSHVTVLGVDIANVSLVKAVKDVLAATRDHRRTSQFAFVNADCLNIAFGNAEYKSVLNQARVFGDGSGVRYACNMTGQKIIDNVNGTDMLPLLCEQARAEGKSIYLLGGRPGVADKAVARITQRYPGIAIAGYQHGFFTTDETDDVIRNINESKADILLVALGAPDQDLFIAEHLEDLQIGAAIGVGGLFDFLAKEVGRAPRLVRALGLEWVVRWLNEPKRLLKRYLIGNPLFLWRVIRHDDVRTDAQETLRPAEIDFRTSGSKFDLWQDFELLDEVGKKYSKPKAASRELSYWWHTRAYLTIKRLIDISVATAAILLLSPILLLTTLAIYLDNPGPIIFKQQRVGFRGRTFTMFKFRSMRADAEKVKGELMAQNESQAGVLFKMKRDPRITRVGRVIRKFSIDELPQLFNVLFGDMTLVGPRPPVPAEVVQYTLAQRRRLEVVPGITCIWQVSGRSDIDFVGQVDLDLRYIRERSLTQDLRLLLKTIPAVLLAKGAY